MLGETLGHPLADSAAAAGYERNSSFEKTIPENAGHEGSR